jgi:hypothetical protein
MLKDRFLKELERLNGRRDRNEKLADFAKSLQGTRITQGGTPRKSKTISTMSQINPHCIHEFANSDSVTAPLMMSVGVRPKPPPLDGTATYDTSMTSPPVTETTPATVPPPTCNDSEPPPLDDMSKWITAVKEKIRRNSQKAAEKALLEQQRKKLQTTEPDTPATALPTSNMRYQSRYPFDAICEYSLTTHNGIDLLRDRSRDAVTGGYDDPISSVIRGRVEYIYDRIEGSGMNGLSIRVIDDDNGITTVYLHLAQITVSDGQMVSAGDQIGIMGATGMGGGTTVGVYHESFHLHFGVSVDGEWVSPLDYFDWHDIIEYSW